jgi:hypothetical protein
MIDTIEEYAERGFKNPPTGYKNIDLAKIQIGKLEKSVKECDSDTPALVFSSTRWLENAFYSREIIEEDYDKLMAKIKGQTRQFMNKCECSETK